MVQNKMKAIICSKYGPPENLKQSLCFIILVIGLSYLIFWGPIALFKVRTGNLVEGKIYNIPALILFIVGGFVPSLVGIILTRFYEGKEGLKKLFLSAVSVKIGLPTLLVIMVYPILLGSLQLILYTFLGGSFDFSQFITYLYLPLP